jgi:hypothetical protein
MAYKRDSLNIGDVRNGGYIDITEDVSGNQITILVEDLAFMIDALTSIQQEEQTRRQRETDAIRLAQWNEMPQLEVTK